MEEAPFNPRYERNKGSDVVARIFGIVMVILYVTLGITIIFNAVDIGTISQEYARIFGVMLILYGMFRGYKIYRRHFFKSES